MRVIFLHDVPRVGKKNDVKEIHDGYAMNYLFPKKLAVQATARAIADLEKRKQEIVIEREVQESLLLKNLAGVSTNDKIHYVLMPPNSLKRTEFLELSGKQEIFLRVTGQ